MTTSTHNLEIPSPEVERVSIEPQFKGNIQQCMADLAFAVDEQLKQAVSESEQVVRKQVLSELRERYGTELALALTDRDRTAGGFRIAMTKAEEAEGALATLQTDFQQFQNEKMELEVSLQCALQCANEKLSKAGPDQTRLEANLQQSELKLSQAEHSIAELQNQARQLETEKLEIETKLQQAETKFLADRGHAQAGRQDLETELQEVRTRCSETEQITMRLRIDLQRSQNEKQEVEGMLAKANSQFTEIEQSLIGLRSEMELEQSSKQEMERRLAETCAVAEQSSLSMTKLQADLQDAQSHSYEIERKLKDEITAREEVETRLKIVTAIRTTLETKLADVQSMCAELETQFNKADSSRSALERQLQKIQADLQTAKAEPHPRGVHRGKGGVSTISSDKLDLEVGRIESMLAELTKLLDDPEATLATIMRKNVEKCDLESYLMGIRFVLGQGEPR